MLKANGLILLGGGRGRIIFQGGSPPGWLRPWFKINYF